MPGILSVILSALGMYPLTLTIMQKLVPYFLRLKCMDEYFLVKKVFRAQSTMYDNECLNQNLVKKSYFHSIYSIVIFCKCCKFQLNKVGTDMSKSSKSILKKHFQEMFTILYKNTLDKITESNIKLRTYNLVKRDYKRELYIYHINSAKLRRSISKFRLSDHSLPIEFGRRLNIPVENRFCKKM